MVVCATSLDVFMVVVVIGGKRACYKCSCFEVLEQAKCYKSESLDARPAGKFRLT